MSVAKLLQDIRAVADTERARHAQLFFKTGKGEYAEGDIFIGLMVPQSREIARKYFSLTLEEVTQLLRSKIHEERLIGLFILVKQYKKANEKTKKDIYDLYLANSLHINNWDLVDSSAPQIVGEYLWEYESKREILEKLAYSSSIWERRIAILATFTFIKYKEFTVPLHIAEMLINDKHDLIHKAVGWMLREIGKRSLETEEIFLLKHYKSMPRTMLRYAIEKFPEETRNSYLHGKL